MKIRILKLVGLFIFFVLLLTPASLMSTLLPSQNGISLVGISGSLWSGKIEQVSAANLQLDDVAFSINPFAFFTATLSVDLKIPKGDVSGGLNLALDSDYKKSLVLDDVELKLGADKLQGYLPLKGVELKGNISTSDLMLKIKDKKPAAIDGLVSWKRAGVSFAGNTWMLGDFVVDATSNEEKNEIIAELQKTKNELGLQGKATLSANGTLEFVGSIATDIDKSLYRAVALFNNGKPENGRLPIKFKQKVL